ncbi:MAG: hypothetical protein ABSH41_04810 [Syntrophobacteraceae bacterium]
MILVSLCFILSSCVLHRDITMYSTGYNQPINGYLEGTLFSGTAEVHVTMPDGETLNGRATFYWGAGYKQELATVVGRHGQVAFGISQGGQRMCHATLIGASGMKLECSADVDPNTGHGVGECLDDAERQYTWHF